MVTGGAPVDPQVAAEVERREDAGNCAIRVEHAVHGMTHRDQLPFRQALDRPREVVDLQVDVGLGDVDADHDATADVGGEQGAGPAAAGVLAAHLHDDAEFDQVGHQVGDGGDAEVGLSGEIRAVSQVETRIKEAAKIGFERAVIPATNADKVKGGGGVEVIGVRNVEEFLEVIFG